MGNRFENDFLIERKCIKKIKWWNIVNIFLNSLFLCENRWISEFRCVKCVGHVALSQCSFHRFHFDSLYICGHLDIYIIFLCCCCCSICSNFIKTKMWMSKYCEFNFGCFEWKRCQRFDVLTRVKSAFNYWIMWTNLRNKIGIRFRSTSGGYRLI